MPDFLNDPLGVDRSDERAGLRERPWGVFAAIGMVAIAVSLAAFVFVTDDGRGGEPAAVAAIEVVPPAPRAPAPPPVPAQNAADVTGSIANSTSTSTAAPGDSVSVEHGVRVVRAGAGPRSGGSIVAVQSDHDDLPRAPDPRLVEQSRYGLLPKIGADGLRPADAYARPVVPGSIRPGTPRIALVVGGLGASAATTSDLATLPAAVTFGFAPQDGGLEKQAAQARAAGHEMVLQLPLEGEGQRSLSPDQERARIADTMSWALSRMSGYVGVAGVAKAQFLTRSETLRPVLADVARRGLLFLDGDTAQSQAAVLAPGVGLELRRADVVIDMGSEDAASEAALARLEGIARAKGIAVGVIGMSAANMARVSTYARGLEARGFALVPLSAARPDPPATARAAGPVRP